MKPKPVLAYLLAVQILVSAASLVVEIVAGRMLAPYVGMSLYTWTSVIAVVLAGFSAGHWVGGRVAERETASALSRTGWHLLAAALTTAISVQLLQVLANSVIGGINDPLFAIVTLCMLVFFLPSFFAGIPAPVLAHISVQITQTPGRALGAMFAAGAIGAIGGTLLAGFVFISWLGTSVTLTVVTLVYLITGLSLLMMSRKTGWLTPTAVTVLALAFNVVTLSKPSFCTVESNYFCIRTVDVSADQNRPVRLMVLDHLGHGMGARDLPTVMFTEHAAMLDALARMRAPSPGFTSFFIGGGTYSVPRSFSSRGTGQITVAEIDPAVTAVAARDFWFDPATVRIFEEDARHALSSRPEERYDIIIGDAFTDIAVPQHLVTKEFFETVRDRLTPDGSYIMNVIDFEGNLRVIASMAKTLGSVFPIIEIWVHAAAPEPGERMVFVLVGGFSQTPVNQFSASAPDKMTFAALDDAWVANLIETKGQLLTDDYSPIDRLIGLSF